MFLEVITSCSIFQFFHSGIYVFDRNIRAFFWSVWVLDFWPRKNSNQSASSKESTQCILPRCYISTIHRFYPISLRNITVLMLLTVFAAVITWDNLRHFSRQFFIYWDNWKSSRFYLRSLRTFLTCYVQLRTTINLLKLRRPSKCKNKENLW